MRKCLTLRFYCYEKQVDFENQEYGNSGSFWTHFRHSYHFSLNGGHRDIDILNNFFEFYDMVNLDNYQALVAKAIFEYRTHSRK